MSHFDAVLISIVMAVILSNKDVNCNFIQKQQDSSSSVSNEDKLQDDIVANELVNQPLSPPLIRDNYQTDETPSSPCVIINETVANCSNLNLTSIKQLTGLQKNVTKLLLDHNNIQAFPKLAFSSLGLIHLKKLDISNNFHVIRVDRHAFSGLENLYELSMNNLMHNESHEAFLPSGLLKPLKHLSKLNLVNWAGKTDEHLMDFSNLLCNRSVSNRLSHLNVSGINDGYLWVMKPPLFECIANTLKTLDLSRNRIVSIRAGILEKMTKLQYLDISHNVILGGDFNLHTLNLHEMSSLEVFYYQYQLFVKFPRSLYPDPDAFETSLTIGRTDQHDEYREAYINNYGGIDASDKLGEEKCHEIRLPPKLTDLYLSHRNSLYRTNTTKRCINGNNRLKYLDISHNWLEEFMYGDVFNFPELEYLNMHNSRMVFSNISMLKKVCKLKYLNVRNCDLDYVTGNNLTNWNDIIYESCLGNLEKLDLSGNYLSQLPTDIFANLLNIKHINISNNKLHQLDFNISMLSNLESLDFSENRIKNFSRYTRKMWTQLSHKKNFSVNLLSNHFSCTCGDFTFIQWLRYAERINFTGITCAESIECNTAKDSCEYNITSDNIKTYYDAILNTCNDQWLELERCLCYSLYMLVLVAIFITSICSRYKWHVLYAWYFTKSVFYQSKQESVYLDNLFDAFVCYSRHDTSWVMSYLYPKLEREDNYQLCIHERNFEPGVPVDVNILEAFNLSRRILLVISRHALSSRYLNFELHMAREQKRSRVICILLEDEEKLPKNRIPPTLKYLFSTTTYLVWPKVTERQPLFWLRLKDALGKPSLDSQLNSLHESNAYNFEESHNSTSSFHTITRNNLIL